MKKKIIIPLVLLLLLLTGAFIGWLVYDAYREEEVTEYLDTASMVKENADTAFVFDKEEKLTDNIRGYIIDPEKDMAEATEDAAKAVFQKVDAIQPNTVLIKYDKDKLSLLTDTAKEEGLDVIILLPESMMSEKNIESVCETYGAKAVCIDLSENNKNIEKAEKLREKVSVKLGVYLNENLTDGIKQSIESSALDFYFVRIDSTADGNAEATVKNWAETALKSDSKVYGVLCNDNVTDENPGEILSVLKFTYNYGGFSGCIMADREKLSTDDHQTATKLYSYYEYFNDVSYTALTITDFKVKDGNTAVEFSGTTDSNFPTHVWCTASGKWSTAATQGEDGKFTVTLNLNEGKNKIVLKHKNAMYTYYIDRAVDVMMAYSAVCDGEKVTMTATAKNGASVFASVANTYTVELNKVSENGDYAEYCAEYELSAEMSLLTNEQVSFAAVYNGIEDIAMCSESAKASPYNDSGLGRADMCAVTKNYAETTSTAAEDDSSDPTCTPQLAGAYGYISSYLVSDNYIICVTDTGMKLHLEDTVLILDGYTLPDNNINLDSVSTNDGTTLTFSVTYPTFVKLVTAPQDYYTGYLERIYNVESFTAEYADITFMDTKTCTYSAEPDFTGSQIFSSAQWYTNTDTDTITLRLYLKEKNSFNGYSLSIDEDGKIIISFKNNPASLEGTVIMLDPGHGGYGAPGTSYNLTVYEESITYSIAEKAAEILRQNGATVIVTRGVSEAMTLAERVALARETKPDVFVSIHCDGADNTSWLGTHTFYYKNYSMPLASSIHAQLVNAYRNYYYTDPASEAYEDVDMGCKFFPFMVTRIEECPSVLVECGYLTNESDAKFMASEGGQQILATAIAQGIVDYIVNY